MIGMKAARQGDAELPSQVWYWVGSSRQANSATVLLSISKDLVAVVEVLGP